MKQGNYNS